MTQQELELTDVIDSHEKLISAIVDKLKESWMAPEDKLREIAEDVHRLVLESRGRVAYKTATGQWKEDVDKVCMKCFMELGNVGK